MKNRYLYRAKRIDNGEWEIGSLIALPDGKFEIANKCENPPDGDPMWRKCVITHYVDPSTICQCTGLKDKNGKLIWENDIAMTVYDGIEKISIVKWDSGELGFKGADGKDDYGCEFQYLTYCEEIEVIGNTFDNPELLEELRWKD